MKSSPGLAAAHTRDVYYAYDLRGLQTRARFDSLAGEGITNSYDGFGRLVSSTSDMGGIVRTVGHRYNAGGNRERITHPDSNYFTYVLDGLGRPTWIVSNDNDPVTNFTYGSAGRRGSSAWGMATYSYDPAGRLQTLTHNPLGTNRDHVLGFVYNPASQISNRSASNDAFAWTAASNLARPYAVNGLNQYTSAGSATFNYDPSGNLASTVNAPWSTAYVYDVENRLVSASGTHNAELSYDPLGRLWQVSSGGAVRRLLYDGDALIDEYDGAGNVTHRYVHGNGAGDDPLVWYHVAVEGWRRVLLTDHQGSVVGVTDMYGNSIAANSYDPWGIPAANNLGRFGYTGQTWVPELGLWYYKARFYSPTTGRFLQTDPVGYEDDVNLYAYVGNDPVNYTDPNGLRRFGWVIELLEEGERRLRSLSSSRAAVEARRREENVRVTGGRQAARQVERAAASNPDNVVRHSGHKLKGGGQGRSHFQTEGKRGHTFYDLGAALVGGLAVALDVLDQATNPLNDSGLSECQDRGACQNGVVRTPEQREQYIQEERAKIEQARRREEEAKRRGGLH